MIKFFGLLSKKKKVKLDALVSIYCKTLDEVISHGFVEIKDFINNNNNLENNPNLKEDDVKWFRLIIYLGNLNNLKSHFEEEEVFKLRNLIVEDISRSSSENEKIAGVESFLQYESYFEDLLNEFDSEEFWDEYVYFNDEEYMKRYKENYVYSDKSIINYKTKKPINIKISFF